MKNNEITKAVKAIKLDVELEMKIEKRITIKNGVIIMPILMGSILS